MEEIKLLVSIIKDLPNTAMLVLIGFLIYKLAVIGSVYGVIRLAINNLHSWAIKRKDLPIDQTARVQSLVISGCFDSLVAQLHRVAGKGIGFDSEYIHRQSVDWLREAIDAKIASEQTSCVDPKFMVKGAP